MKQSNNKITAFYLRISREDKDRDESYSISNQRKLLNDVALRLSLTNVREYTDDGITGTRRDRKQFEQLQADIVKGEIGVVMVKEVSRLGRKYPLYDLYFKYMMMMPEIFQVVKIKHHAETLSIHSVKP